MSVAIAAAVLVIASSGVRLALEAGTGLTSTRTAEGTVVQSGYLTVGESGLYNFGMTADVRSQLFIDNVLVIDFGAHRPDGARTGSVPLSAGSHRVLLEYTQSERQPPLDWSWSRGEDDEAAYRTVPSWALSQRPVSYHAAVAVRLLDLIWYLAAAVVAAAVAARFAAWILQRREAWTAWGHPYRTSATGFYLLLTALCIGLALGPPYGLWQYVYWWPGFNFIRGSSRFMVLGLLGIAVLSAIGFERLVARLRVRRDWTAAVMGALLVGEFAMVPYRGVPYTFTIPEVDRWIATQPEPFTVAEVPVTWSERYHSNYMLHSMAHWQKTVHGYSGIRPVLHEELYEQLKTFPNDASLRNLTQLGVKYIVVHSSWFTPEGRVELEQRLPAFGAWLTLEYMDADSRVYSIHPPAKEEP